MRSGVGSSYSRAIDVEDGELLYLLVDYQDRPRDGFTLHFHYDPPPPPPVVQVFPQTLLIDVTDATTGAALDAALTVEGKIGNFDLTYVFSQLKREVDSESDYSDYGFWYDTLAGYGAYFYDDNGTLINPAQYIQDYEFRMDTYRKLRINCLRKGYMFQTERVKPSGDEQLQVNIKLTPIKQGARVVLDDIRFVGNDSKVMRSSEGSLYLLLHFMEQNPTTKVEIQGHVNGPTYKKNTNEFVELSTERAQTVYNFLLINDVEPSRLSYVGLGNSHMLYPNAKNKFESEANRRVEVRITAM